MPSANYWDDDFGLTSFKGGGGKSKNRKNNEKKNPDGKYTSKHVRMSQKKIENSKSSRTSNTEPPPSSKQRK